MHAQVTGKLLDGSYLLGAEIGSGGMSRIFEAEDLKLMRQVAIKLLLAGGQEESPAERLFREAKAAARANHPAVITMFGYGTDEALELDYLVMERLHGEDLGARIARSGPLPAQVAVSIGSDIADALAAVHAASVVHRDLKPSNVFLARRGRRVDEVTLLDFGVAKHLDMYTLTGSGELLGSLAYMAPEQIRDPKCVNAQSDIYALGALLYECLTGTPPFVAHSILELRRLALRAAAPRLSGKCPDLNPALAHVIERCLAPSASDRYPDARAVCDALQAALH